MAKNNTLTDLSDYLSQNPNEIELGSKPTKEEFLKKKPNSLVEIPKVKSETKNAVLPNGTGLAEIASYLHQKAESEGKSFADIWMELLEEGAKIDPLLKNTSVFKTLRHIQKTSFNVVLEGISHIIKNKK